MDTCDKYMTSYRAAHKFIPTVVFESNVSAFTYIRFTLQLVY